MNNISEILLHSFFPGYKITNFSKDDASKHLEISLEPIEPPVCPHCNSHNVVVHQYRKRKVIDEKLLGYFVTLVISYRTVTCNYCSQNGTEDIPFVAQRHRVTKRAQQAVIDDLERAGSIKDTAERTGIHWDTCKTIHKNYLQDTISFTIGSATRIAIDEFSIQKGHKYATVVVDIDTKRVLWVGKGKSITEVNCFFEKVGTEGCKQIKAVAMDQNAGFANCVARYCPNAKVVYDLFHMVYNFGRLVISAIRIDLANDHKQKDDEVGYELIKRSRYLLLSRNSKLSDKQKVRLDDILNHYKDLYAANELKELLPEVFYANSKEDSERLWDEWVDIALHSEVEEIIRFASNQNKNYRDGITNSGIYNIRTSVLEGINNKIKVLKRLAYGFRDLDYFFLRIRNAFRGITA